ncbi:MAG: ribonuclease HII [Candidatus Eisenbacteria bacterium]|nr:ribonuclease HII [Candidatus Eisenbacteria bacterium]
MAERDEGRALTGLPDIKRMTVREVSEYVAGARPEPGDALWRALLDDPRAGVRAECERLLRKKNAECMSAEREARMRRNESELWALGIERVAGVDEAGRGPLAGPVVAAAVVLPRELGIKGIDDSKKLTPERREDLFERIMVEAVAVGVGSSSEKVIDEINILNATFAAMREAIARLESVPGHVLVDGNEIPGLGFPQTGIPNGDGRSTAIAAASIVAKVTRDRMLVELDSRYPGYGFARHKGYGTPDHLSALIRLGPCEIHRRSFRVVTDATGGLSELYDGFKRALIAAKTVDRLERIATEIATEKHRLIPHELTRLRTLYKRCRVRLNAGVGVRR